MNFDRRYHLRIIKSVTFGQSPKTTGKTDNEPPTRAVSKKTDRRYQNSNMMPLRILKSVTLGQSPKTTEKTENESPARAVSQKTERPRFECTMSPDSLLATVTASNSPSSALANHRIVATVGVEECVDV